MTRPPRPPRLRAPKPEQRVKAQWRQTLGAQSHRRGHAGEWIAALLLMAKGYQIIGFRLKTPAGEIDILARRGGVLAVVEVKRRRTLDEALLSLTPKQHQRLLRAGATLAHSRPSLNTLDMRIDMVALAPGRFPRHIRGLVA